jgi:hypothetical protein
MKFLIVVVGFISMVLILKYRNQVRGFIGDVAFAERFLGSGGTNTLIVIIGILTFVLSLMYAMGTLQSLLSNTAGRFF